jgi:hypothetical protein
MKSRIVQQMRRGYLEGVKVWAIRAKEKQKWQSWFLGLLMEKYAQFACRKIVERAAGVVLMKS